MKHRARELQRRLTGRIVPQVRSPESVRRMSGIRRLYGEIAWHGGYGFGPMIMSWLRIWWVKVKNPHAEIHFDGYSRIGPGFSLDMPQGGRFIVGKYNDFRRGFRCEVGPNGTVKIGDLCVFSYYSLIQCDTSIEIGDRAMFGQSSIVVDGNHRFRDPSVPLARSGYEYKSIKIENDVTTLTKVTIVDNLGTKSVVGANSVVTKPVPPYSLVAGVPARLLDYFGPPELEPEAWRERKRAKGIPDPPPRSGALEVSGHSMAFGAGASAFANRFSSRLADRLELDEVNRSRSGAIACWPETGWDPGDGGYAHVLHAFERPGELRADWTPPAAALVFYGLNDLALLGPGDLRPFQHALRTIIGRHRASAVFEEDHGSVSADATWQPRSADGPDCSGSGLLETDTAGASLEIAVADDFAGGAIALGFTVGRDTDATIELAVDREAPVGFEMRGATEPVLGRRNGVLARLTGVSPGAHTVACRLESCNGPIGFDYWHVEPMDPPRVLVPLAYALLNPLHHYADWPHQPTPESVAALNSATREVVGEFDGALAVDIADPAGPAAELFSWEGVYLNDAGHEGAAEALFEAAGGEAVRGRSAA